MAYTEVSRMEYMELVRRWQSGASVRQVARGLGQSRNTVRRYLVLAQACGLRRDGPPPTDDQLAALAAGGRAGPHRVEAPTEGLLEPWVERVREWLEKDQLRLTRVQELLAQHGCVVPYRSLYRFVARRGWWPKGKGRTTVRMADTKPGEVAEFDFGRLGYIWDPETERRRLLWALVIVLVYSRHCFVWPLFKQQLADIIEGLDASWAFFQGLPQYLVLDNFPAAVAGADSLHPRLTRGFLEYSQHRGFIADPARVRRPQDKPHCERHIDYVQERLFKGGQFQGLADARSQARTWCLEVAGQRVHGTTRRLPLVVFREEEQASLLPWNGEPYEVADWGSATVHPDHHISFRYAIYSAPHDICPPRSKVEVRGDSKLVSIYYQGKLVKVHPRQPRGGRSTDPNDYPPERTTYALRAPNRVKRQAAELGTAVATFADHLLSGPLPWAKLRQGQKLLRLGDRYGADRLDAACQRALEVDLIDVRRVERILVEALEQETTPSDQVSAPLGSRFARPGNAFARRNGNTTQDPTATTQIGNEGRQS